MSTQKTPEQRQRIQRLARENKLRNKLANNEAHQRQLASQKKSNDAKKLRVAAQRASGIKIIPKPLTERDKERMRIYARRKRAEATAIRIQNKPPKVVPVKKRNKEPKDKPMEKILKARPERKISEKVVKPVKIDASRQTVCKIKADDTGKVKVQLNARTWVMARPGYDLEALRRKFKVV